MINGRRLWSNKRLIVKRVLLDFTVKLEAVLIAVVVKKLLVVSLWTSKLCNCDYDVMHFTKY